METRRYLGLVYEALGEKEKAREQYEAMLSDGNQDPSVYEALGAHQLRVKNYEAALDYFVKGIENAGDLASEGLYFGEAVCYEYLGQYEIALEKFQNYVNRFGETEEVNKEIAFLKTRK